MAITFGAGVNFSGGITLGVLPLGAPTVTTATALSTSSAAVKFIPPTETGGTPVTAYTITSNPGNISVTVPANTTTAVVSGLTQSQTYTFTVQASSPLGTSPFSSFAGTATIIWVPGAPIIGTVSFSGSTASVPFTAPSNNGGTAITSYTATSSPGGITGTLSQAGSGNISVPGLTIGTAYTFTVIATNVVGNSFASSASNSITPITVPGAPTIGTATATGQTTANIAFTAPASNGGTAITSYTATSSPGGITGTLSQAGSGTISVTGLSGLANYTFTITATNSVGTSSSSSASNSITTWRSPGSCVFTSPGTYCWIAPSGIYNVSAVVVGGGGGGERHTGAGINFRGGAGGGLAYKNNVSITSGGTYRVIVGAAGTGQNSFCGYYSNYTTVAAAIKGGCSSVALPGGTLKATGGTLGANNFYCSSQGGYPCGFYDGGGTGGVGYQLGNYTYGAIGGGGAGGYSGNGGAGRYARSCGGVGCQTLSGTAGAGGGGGGGGATVRYQCSYGSLAAGNGGGVGLYGQGSNGTAGTAPGTGYCVIPNGGPGSGGSGQSYGGGGRLVFVGNSYGCAANGGSGAVRIMWPGCARRFPSTCASTP